MVHDCSLTESSVVIYDMPVVFDLEMAMSGKGLPYRWDPEYPARLGVLPRDGAAEDVRWYDIEPCYVFHPLNAYDDGERIVLDVVRHPKMFAKNLLGPNEGKPTLDRWTIDTSAGKVLEERIDDRGQEFPRVDERVVGRRHRFGYSVGATEDRSGDVDLSDNTVGIDLKVQGKNIVVDFVNTSLPKNLNRDPGYVFVSYRPEERVRGEIPSSERSSSQKRERPSARSRMTRSVHLPQTMSAVRQTGQSELGTNASLAQDFNY
jgi:carotenoid cleavage dioxygenase-like enzyme